MTITYKETGEGSLEDIFAETRATYVRAKRVVDQFCNEIEDGTIEDVERFKQSYAFFKALIPQVMNERERLEREHAKRLGIVGDNTYALDFDAARQEVGRRLACLATAGGEGELSE
jgi:hypothetical protein